MEDGVMSTKAELAQRLEQAELELEALRLERHIAESEQAAPTRPERDKGVIAFVRRVIRPGRKPYLNIRLADGVDCDEQTIAEGLGESIVWVGEPRQDSRGGWWTNVLTAADDAAFRQRQRDLTPDGYDV